MDPAQAVKQHNINNSGALHPYILQALDELLCRENIHVQTYKIAGEHLQAAEEQAQGSTLVCYLQITDEHDKR